MKEIKNAKIIGISMPMGHLACLDFYLKVNDGNKNYTINCGPMGFGCRGSMIWKASGVGLVAIMKIMDVVGVDAVEQLKDKYIRIEILDDTKNIVHKIGNILTDKWFDVAEFFNNANGEEFILDEHLKEEDNGNS